ncbi:MAG: alanine racemase [Abditibacteriota bacterium]|nr:alanine racemase [Abditibacteriota bacterium]
MYSLRELQKAESEYGSPLYIFRENDFRANYLRFRKIFESHYPKYHIAYSYKTNYTPYICGLVKEMGGWAEVVSDMELGCALKCGYSPDRVIYNGPCKGPASIDLMLKGGIVNADNLEEAEKLCSAAREAQGKELRIGLRVNIDIGQSFVSRFGLDASGEDLDRAFRRIAEEPNLRVCGLHCHIGRSRSLEAWQRRAEEMLSLADRYFDPAPDFLDLGSGMFGEMDPALAAQFGDELPDYEAYASAALDRIEEHYRCLPLDRKPLVFTEPGTTLVNSYMDFAARITGIKRIKGMTFVILNCSKHNLGEICTLKQLPVRIVPAGGAPRKLDNAALTGYTCLEHDVMLEGWSGSAAVGDYVIFANTGGYSNVSKPPFIEPNCAMIAAGERTKLIKRRETFENVFATYIF